MLADVINDYALERDWIFFVRSEYLRKCFLKRRLDKYPYLHLDGMILWVIDGRRKTGDRSAPYVNRRFDIAEPTCFDQIEAFLKCD